MNLNIFNSPRPSSPAPPSHQIGISKGSSEAELQAQYLQGSKIIMNTSTGVNDSSSTVYSGSKHDGEEV